MDDKKFEGLEDQLNILFDDFSKTEPVDDGEKMDQLEKVDLFKTETESDPVKNTTIEIPVNAVKKAAEEKKENEVVDDTAFEPDYENVDFGFLDSIVAAEEPDEEAKKPAFDQFEFEAAERKAYEQGEEMPSDDSFVIPEDEEDMEDPLYYSDEEEDVKGASVRHTASGKGKRKGSEEGSEKNDSKTFWIFTCIVALVVAAAIVFILYKRGIIFNEQAEQPTTIPVTSVETTATIPEITTTEAVSTKATKETKATKATTAETKKETTTASSTAETTTKATEPAEDTSSVLKNYTKIFVVTGTNGGSGLNIRESASSEAGIVGVIPENGGGNIIGEEGAWYKVSSGGIEGFVSKDFVKSGEEAKDIAIKNAVKKVKALGEPTNIRSTQSTENETNIIESVPAGTALEFVGKAEGFYQIKTPGGKDGYVSTTASEISYFLKEAKKS